MSIAQVGMVGKEGLAGSGIVSRQMFDFRFHVDSCDHRARAPMIELDAEGRVTQSASIIGCEARSTSLKPNRAYLRDASTSLAAPPELVVPDTAEA